MDKYKVLAALVRGFFEGFTAGIIDCYVTDAKEKFQSKTIKKVMLNHYEQISDAFDDIMFYPLSGLNYTQENLEKKLREFDPDKVTMIDILKMLCRTKVFYDSMIAEYQRNFEQLLQGRIITVKEHSKLYTRHNDEKPVDSDTAISLTVNTVMVAYARGIKMSGTGKASLHQATIFRLMIDTMATLTGNEVPSIDTKNGQGLSELFMKACKTEHNFEVMTNEMDRTYTELMESEGIISNDDSAN